MRHFVEDRRLIVNLDSISGLYSIRPMLKKIDNSSKFTKYMADLKHLSISQVKKLYNFIGNYEINLTEFDSVIFILKN